MAAVGFEPTPPKRPASLDHSATLPYALYSPFRIHLASHHLGGAGGGDRRKNIYTVTIFSFKFQVSYRATTRFFFSRYEVVEVLFCFWLRM